VILLDTDHLTLLKYPDSPRYAALTARMEASPDQEVGTTIISVEEQWRGWLAVISRERDVTRQVRAYQELAGLLDFLGRWTVLPFDEAAAACFSRQRGDGVRIGAMDLKIASIALVHNAMLLSANLRDFQQVPGLRVENWLD
jgi:tRNA(fMet)-specific endonuclease VapC